MSTMQTLLRHPLVYAGSGLFIAFVGVLNARVNDGAWKWLGLAQALLGLYMLASGVGSWRNERREDT